MADLGEVAIVGGGIGETAEFPMAMMLPDIAGTLNLRHPVACQALVDAAAEAGATVVRGVRDVKLADGSSPSVSYTTKDGAHQLRTSLIVGADGRNSTVRKQVGITLERQEHVSYIAGLLVDGLDDVPDEHDVLASGDGGSTRGAAGAPAPRESSRSRRRGHAGSSGRVVTARWRHRSGHRAAPRSARSARRRVRLRRA